MSLLEDVFLENEAGEAQELERIIEGDEYDERPRSRSDSDENSAKEDEAEEDKRRVDPTSAKPKRVIKNPRFVLNPARLTGPRGIQVITEHFKDFKFKGKGHEREDLDLVLKKLEHWAYRLYPKYKFEDCLKKIETLGKKRAVAVHLHRIRMDQISSEETVVQKDSSDDEAPPAQEPEEDEFDKLLKQQIEIARATPAPGSVKKTPFSDRSSLMPKATSSPSINDEQRERMLKNRRMAEERRLARLNQNMSQDTPVEKPKSPTKIGDVSKESRDKSMLDNSDGENVSRNKNGNKIVIVELDVDDMVVTKSPKCYIPAKKQSVYIDADESNTNNIVELDNDGKVITESPKRNEPPKKHNKSRIDSSDDDDALVINEFDDDKQRNSRAKSIHKLADKNKARVLDSSDDDNDTNEPTTIDVDKLYNSNTKQNRSNIIDSSDSEEESIVMNESITVDIHDSHKSDINVSNKLGIEANSNNNDSVFVSLRSTEKQNDVIMEDEGIEIQSDFFRNVRNNGNTDVVTNVSNKCIITEINDHSIKEPNTKETVINVSETQKSTESIQLNKDNVQVLVEDEIMEVDFSDDF